MIKAYNLGIKNFDIVDRLKTSLNFENIFIRNDAKCAGLCEKMYGSLKNYSNCVFICLGTGIGSAVFMENRMLSAKEYAGFELGHMVIERNGRECTCGRKGCFETYASMKVFKTNINERMKIDECNGDSIYDVIVKNKNDLQDIIDEYIRNLCIGFTNIINIFEPEAICIGGSFVHFKNILLEPLVRELRDDCKIFDGIIPEIVMAQMGNDAGVIGATIM